MSHDRTHTYRCFDKAIGVLLLWAVFLYGCQTKQEVVISGSTMGTTYSVKVVTTRLLKADALKQKIEQNCVF